MGINPFKKGSTSYLDFETMSDLKWHCTKCELKSGQAKTWQVWRQEKGITLKQDGDKYYKNIFCSTCDTVTVHRGLVSTDINLEDSKARTSLSPKLAKRIKIYYKFVDAYTLRTEIEAKLEVDHRFPQVRWTSDEEYNDSEMSESEIQGKFMLLTRENNLLKSRFCEKCKNSGVRPGGYGIDFWYAGDSKWNEETKCKGCFWFDPQAWRCAVAKILKKDK